jgi:hypothetical protein
MPAHIPAMPALMRLLVSPRDQLSRHPELKSLQLKPMNANPIRGICAGGAWFFVFEGRVRRPYGSFDTSDGAAMSDDYGEKLHAALDAALVRATTRPNGTFDVRPEAIAAVMVALAIAALRADRDLPAALYWLRDRMAEVIADELSATRGKDTPPLLPEREGTRAQVYADEATRLVVTYATLLQAHPCHFMDASWLPADKQKMIEIFKKLWLGGDEEQRKKVENWWCLLARFQAGVGANSITYEIPNDITVKEWRERVEQVERWGELVTAEDQSYEREIERFKAGGQR